MLIIVNGIFSLIFCIISAIVGTIIASKYFKYKDRSLLFVGLSFVLICEIWWASAISFLVALVNGVGLSPQIYFLIGNLLVPVALIIWLTAFTTFLNVSKRNKKIILILVAIYGIIFEIFLFYSLLTDISLFGSLEGPVFARYTLFPLTFLLSVLIIFLITGILFFRETLKSEDSEAKLKGTIFLLAVISFAIGAGLDGLRRYVPAEFLPYFLIITRLILIASAILFYFAFLGKMEESKEMEIDSEEEKAEIQDFLKMVSRHKRGKLTEEEIKFYRTALVDTLLHLKPREMDAHLSLYREHKICLACKGDVVRFHYICPKCKALYCFICYELLSDINNSCWVCNRSFVKSILKEV
jgi:hypothetical protein